MKACLCILRKVFAYPQGYKYPKLKTTAVDYTASQYRHVGEKPIEFSIHQLYEDVFCGKALCKPVACPDMGSSTRLSPVQDV